MSSHGKESFPGHKRPLSIAVGAAVASTGAAQAQETALEEIIVTATKRAVSQQDAPIAVTALSDEEISLQRFKTFNDYVGQIPSLALSERQPGANSVVMRGCAAQGLSFSDSATTSVYLDEQPITAAGYNPDPRLVDIARVEALAGPQGTLFGDAAQCGTLRIITNKPDTNNTSGWVNLAGWAVKDGGASYDVSAMMNIPLVRTKSPCAWWVSAPTRPAGSTTFSRHHRGAPSLTPTASRTTSTPPYGQAAEPRCASTPTRPGPSTWSASTRSTN